MGIKIPQFKYVIREMSALPPWYYGYSYANLDYKDRFVVYHIMPFNYVARWYNNFKYWWHTKRNKMSHFDTRVFHMVKLAQAQGFKLGYEKGKQLSDQQAEGIKKFVQLIAEKKMDLKAAKKAIAEEAKNVNNPPA